MTDKPYLGRCKEKGCDYALFATPDHVTNGEIRDILAGGNAVRISGKGVFGRCSNRHKFFTLRQIKGTYSKDHKCDSRCMNAKGHDCTCSCGGINHGRGYALLPHVQPIQPTNAGTKCQFSDDQVKMISDAQSRFIRNLLDERDIPSKGDQSGSERRTKALEILETLTRAQATKTIEWLLTLERG